MSICNASRGAPLHMLSAVKPGSRLVTAGFVLIGSLLSGCVTSPTVPSTAPVASGSAGGGEAVGADASLQTCPKTVGVVRLQDGNASADTSRSQGADATGVNPNLLAVGQLLKDLQGFGAKKPGTNSEGAALEALRLLIQQSNCLVIADRGRAEEAGQDEIRRARGGNEVRDNSKMGRGQAVAADFVLRSMVLEIGTPKSSTMGGGGLLPGVLGGLSFGKSETKAKVQLVLSDVRAGIQLAVAQGDGSGSNTKLAAGVLGRAGGLLGGSLGTEEKTSESTVLMQAFADAYNKLVPAMRNYKQQSVQGGLGTGGSLGVQGGVSDQSKKK